MAIYSKFGCLVRITGYCGKHPIPGYKGEFVLIRGLRTDPENQSDKGAVRYYFATFLRADRGAPEIEAAVDAAPKVKLNPKELAVAIQQAS